VRVRLVFGRAIRPVATLELNRGVLDAETLMQFMRDLFEQVVVELRLALHDVRGAGGLGGAQAPDVEMNGSRLRRGSCSRKFWTATGSMPARHGVENKADRVTQKSPSAEENDRDDREAADRID